MIPRCYLPWDYLCFGGEPYLRSITIPPTHHRIEKGADGNDRMDGWTTNKRLSSYNVGDIGWCGVHNSTARIPDGCDDVNRDAQLSQRNQKPTVPHRLFSRKLTRRRMMRVNRNKKTMMKKTPKRLGVAVNPSVAFMEQDGGKKKTQRAKTELKEFGRLIWKEGDKKEEERENKEKKKNVSRKRI